MADQLLSGGAFGYIFDEDGVVRQGGSPFEVVIVGLPQCIPHIDEPGQMNKKRCEPQDHFFPTY